MSVVPIYHQLRYQCHNFILCYFLIRIRSTKHKPAEFVKTLLGLNQHLICLLPYCNLRDDFLGWISNRPQLKHFFEHFLNHLIKLFVVYKSLPLAYLFLLLLCLFEQGDDGMMLGSWPLLAFITTWLLFQVLCIFLTINLIPIFYLALFYLVVKLRKRVLDVGSQFVNCPIHLLCHSINYLAHFFLALD